MRLPPDHELRAPLEDEMHARPAEVLVLPAQVSYLALFSDPRTRDSEWQQLGALLRLFGRDLPATPRNHYTADLGPLRVRWERHTEFVRYTFVERSDEGSLDGRPALEAVPANWLAGLGGRTLAAIHVAGEYVNEDALDVDGASQRFFHGNALIGASLAGGAAIALTDLRVHDDGFLRIQLLDQGLKPRQAGRLVQTLLELDTYRVLALLALPVARSLSPELTRYERELAAVTSALAAADTADEPALLERLTRLEAEVETRKSAHLYRFDAAEAYYELVQRRLRELRETRLRGLPTFQEFVERRLAPAMTTCRTVAARLESLAERIARANQLLATRIDITRERQNQALLTSMNRRAELQLRLQETVEGLSIAALTYYVVGLVGYAAKGLKAGGVPLDLDITVAASVPVVALAVALALRRLRRSFETH